MLTHNGNAAAIAPRDERRIGWLTALAWSPRGQQLAAASGEELRLYSWSAAAGMGERPLRSLRGHSAPIRCLAFHPKGAILASGGADGRLNLWRGDGAGQRIAEWEEAITALAFSAWG